MHVLTRESWSCLVGTTWAQRGIQACTLAWLPQWAEIEVTDGLELAPVDSKPFEGLFSLKRLAWYMDDVAVRVVRDVV